MHSSLYDSCMHGALNWRENSLCILPCSDFNIQKEEVSKIFSPMLRSHVYMATAHTQIHAWRRNGTQRNIVSYTIICVYRTGMYIAPLCMPFIALTLDDRLMRHASKHKCVLHFWIYLLVNMFTIAVRQYRTMKYAWRCVYSALRSH